MDPEHDLYRDLDHGSNQNRGPDQQIWLNIIFTYNDKCVCTRVGPDPDPPFDLFFAQKSKLRRYPALQDSEYPTLLKSLYT